MTASGWNRLFLVFLQVFVLVLGRPPKANSFHKHLSETGGRIINGIAAQKNQVPYQVLIEDVHPEGNIFCGGALINSGGDDDDQTDKADFVLTAAHCVQRPTTTAILITAGVIDRYDVDSQQRQVTEVYFYAKKPEELIENDIALLKLGSPFPQDKPEIARIHLTNHSLKPGINCTASGWGDTEVPSVSFVTKLNLVHLPILSSEECKEAYPNIEEDRFCAGFMEGEKDTCTGDSGGPLVCEGVLTGVIEGGEGCAKPDKPGTYTDVFYYRCWIDSVLSGHIEPNRTLSDPQVEYDEAEDPVSSSETNVLEFDSPSYDGYDESPDYSPLAEDGSRSEENDNNDGEGREEYDSADPDYPIINNNINLRPTGMRFYSDENIHHYIFTSPDIYSSPGNNIINITVQLTISGTETKKHKFLKKMKKGTNKHKSEGLIKKMKKGTNKHKSKGLIKKMKKVINKHKPKAMLKKLKQVAKNSTKSEKH